MPPYYAHKNEDPLLAGTHHSGWLTCGPTKLKGTEGFVNLVNMNDSSSSDRTMSIQRPSCFFNLCSSCSSSSNKRRRDCLLPRPRGWLYCRAGLTAPILLPPLARPSLHSPTPPVILQRRQPHTAAEPVNARTPLRVGIHCRVLHGSESSPS